MKARNLIVTVLVVLLCMDGFACPRLSTTAKAQGTLLTTATTPSLSIVHLSPADGRVFEAQASVTIEVAVWYSLGALVHNTRVQVLLDGVEIARTDRPVRGVGEIRIAPASVSPTPGNHVLEARAFAVPVIGGSSVEAVPLVHTFSVAADVLILRVRGQDSLVKNEIIATLRDQWNSKKASIEQEWKTAVDGTSRTFSGKIGPIPWSYTITASNTAVTIPDLPSLVLERGPTPQSLEFQATMTVNWSAKMRGTHGTIHANPRFTTDVTVTGTMALAYDPENGYYLQITDIAGDSNTLTDGSIVFTINLGIGTVSFTWSVLDLALRTEVDKKVGDRIDIELAADSNHNGIPDVKEPYYIDQHFPTEALIFPIYSYLSDQNKIAYSLSTENGIPVLELVFGAPIVGAWHPEKSDHPRLLYTASERPAMIARKQADFGGWFTAIKATANEQPVFAIPDSQGIVSEADWSSKEVANAHIALSAALVYDLGGDRAYLYKALRVLSRFRDRIGDPAFTPLWGQKSLFTAEILISLSQAYDLVLGKGFPNTITNGEILVNSIGLPTAKWRELSTLVLLGRGNLARSRLKSFVDAKFKSLRDLTYLQTHVWDLVPNLNIALRNASALGMSALLFNQEEDAYENISLATSVIWKKLGLGSSVPFEDPAQFTKLREGEGFAEGLSYLNYSAQLYLPFMWAYAKFMHGENPLQTFTYNDWVNQYNVVVPDMLTSERVRNIHEWGLKLSLPDGSRPNVKDGNRGTLFYSGLLANATATADPEMRRVWAWDFARSGYTSIYPRLVDHFVTFDPTLVASLHDPSVVFSHPSMVLAEAGSAVFRSGWDSSARHMHLLGDHRWQGTPIVGGTRYPNHQQADNSSFVIHAYGVPLAIDAGYGSFAVRNLVANAVNHNLVLVDGVGPTEATEAFIDASASTDLVDYARVSMAYQDTGIRRNALFIDDTYFVIVDELRSGAQHQYDWLLHGNDTGGQFSTISSGDSLWITQGGQQLLAHVTNTSPNGVDTIQPNLAPHFVSFTQNPGDIVYHTSITARENAAASLAYVATLFPSDGTLALPAMSDFSQANVFAGTRVVFGTYTDIIVVRDPASGASGLYTIGRSHTGFGDIVSDAQILWVRISNADQRLLGIFGQSMSSLTYNGVLYAPVPLTVYDEEDPATFVNPHGWDCPPPGTSHRNDRFSGQRSGDTTYAGNYALKVTIPPENERCGHASAWWDGPLPDTTGTTHFTFAYKKTNPDSRMAVYFILPDAIHEVSEVDPAIGAVRAYQGWDIPYYRDTEWHVVAVPYASERPAPGAAQVVGSITGPLASFEAGLGGGRVGDAVYFDLIQFQRTPWVYPLTAFRNWHLIDPGGDPNANVVVSDISGHGYGGAIYLNNHGSGNTLAWTTEPLATKDIHPVDITPRTVIQWTQKDSSHSLALDLNLIRYQEFETIKYAANAPNHWTIPGQYVNQFGVRGWVNLSPRPTPVYGQEEMFVRNLYRDIQDTLGPDEEYDEVVSIALHHFNNADAAEGDQGGYFEDLRIFNAAPLIFVNNDEWTLSDQGFAQSSDAAQFARNLAVWFAGGRPGNFLVYSTPFGFNTGLVGSELANTMTNAGHTWTVVSTTTTFSLADLLQYDGIFLAGSQADDFDDPPPVVPPDTQVLIDYVKAGGNVYLASGTDPDNPASEAAQWNPFLHACGLDFVPTLNDVDGILKSNSSHPIFASVQRLLQRDGNSIRKLDPSDPNAAILVQSEQGEGLYAVCSIGAPVEGAPTAIDLLSFTAQAGADHVTLTWKTGTEVDNAGFNLWRAMAEDGPYTKLNDALTPAEGDPVSGTSYTYTDTDVVKGVTYYYKLEDVDVHGIGTFHGPVSATPGRVQRMYLPLVIK